MFRSFGNITRLAHCGSIAIFGATMTFAPGCKSEPKQPKPTSAPALEETWREQAISRPAEAQAAYPVKQGTLPLVYLVESMAIVRVADQTANIDLVRMPVPGRTVVSVDEKNGVRIGSATMHLGPLEAGHTYAIYLESSESNIYRSGTIRPGTRNGSTASPAPTSAPDMGHQPPPRRSEP